MQRVTRLGVSHISPTFTVQNGQVHQPAPTDKRLLPSTTQTNTPIVLANNRNLLNPLPRTQHVMRGTQTQTFACASISNDCVCTLLPLWGSQVPVSFPKRHITLGLSRDGVVTVSDSSKSSRRHVCICLLPSKATAASRSYLLASVSTPESGKRLTND